MTVSWPSRLALAAVFLMMLLFALRQSTDPDLGFHLSAGRWIAAHHAAPSVDEFTYTAQGRPYLDQHWLYQAVLYGAYRLGGFRLLTLMNAALILLLFFLLFRLLRRAGTPPSLVPGLLLLGVLGTEIRFELRPEVLSWVLLALTMTILERHRSGDPRALRFLPLVMLLWVNVQALFVLGVAVLGIAVIGGARKGGSWDRPLLRWTGLSLLVLLLNPYGVDGLLFPLKLWSSLANRLYAGTLLEYERPWSRLFDKNPETSAWVYGTYYAFSLGGLLLLLLTWLKRKKTDFLLWGVFFLLSATAVRNIPLFVVATLPLAGIGLRDLLSSRWERWGPRLDKGRLPIAVLAVLLGVRAFTGAYYASERRPVRFGWGVQQDAYPERTAAFLKTSGLTDLRPVNDIPPGDWLPWLCGMKVMADGRLQVLPEEVYRDVVKLRITEGVRKAVDKYGAILAILEPQTTYMPYDQMQWLAGWEPVCLEEECLVLAAPTLAKRLPAMDWNSLLSERGIPKPGPGDAERVLTAPRVMPFQDWLEGFFRRKEHPFGLWNLATVAKRNGRPEIAEAIFLEILRWTGGAHPEAFFQLGEVYYHRGRVDLEELCYRRLQEAGAVPR